MRHFTLIFSAAVLALSGLSAGAVSAQATAAPQTIVVAENSVQHREDLADHDRWNRSQAVGAKDESGDDADDAPASATAKQPKTSPHYGELNGKLHLGEW